MRMFRVLTTLAASLIAIPLPGHADEIPPCDPIPGVETRTLQSDMPVALTKALTEKLGDIAPPGADFDVTDVDVIGRSRRLIFVWARGARWVVATEHGGRGYNDPVFAFDIDPDRSVARLIAERIAYPSTVCSTAQDLLILK
jgi:hypothetical protein